MSRSAGFGRRSRGVCTAPSATTWLRICGVELAEQRLGQRAGGDPGRGLAGAGPLQDVAGVVEAVLLHPDEVGVAGPGLAQRALGGAGRRGHLVLPFPAHSVLWITTATGRAEGAAVADPAEELDPVLLEAHAGPAAEPETAAGQLGGDVLDGDGQARGEAFHDDDERRTVRLPRGQEAKHRGLLGFGARVDDSR